MCAKNKAMDHKKFKLMIFMLSLQDDFFYKTGIIGHQAEDWKFELKIAM